MATKYWIKLYHEILDDPKMGRLSDNLWRRFFECCLLAGEAGYDDDDPLNGRLPSPSDMSWRLRVDEERLLSELEALAKKGLLEYRADSILDGYWFVVQFNQRQRSMSKAEYMRRLRKDRAGVNTALPVSYQPVTNSHADIDIDKEYIYAHDLPEPILNLRTAIVAVVKEALWDETKDRFDDAATVLLGYDATPDQVADFGKWWEKNPQYPGKPALTSLVNNWNNFRAGVVTKTSRLDVGRLWQVVKHQASKGKPEFEDEDVKEAVRLTGWPALQQMSAGQEMMLKKRFEENYDNVKRSRKNS
jgi:hypothetical protein